jgi:hypothetical protein
MRMLGLCLAPGGWETLRETALRLSGWQSRRLFDVDLSLRREATVKDFMHQRGARHDRGTRARAFSTVATGSATGREKADG